MKLILLFISVLSLMSSVIGNIGNILHLTDVHYDQFYKEGSSATCFIAEKVGLRCCRDYDIPISPYRKAGKWGDYDCDTPLDIIEYTLQNSVSQGFDYDYIFWTGDAASHHDLTQSFDINMKAVDTVTDIIQKYYPNTTVIPVIGNHDTWPIDQLLPPFYNTTAVTKYLSKKWNMWIPEESMDTFYYGGYYSMKITDDLLFVVLNCLYEDDNNILDRKTPDPGHQNAWVKSVLKKAYDNKQKVWIIGHIYPGAGESTDTFTNLMINLTRTYPDTITNQFFGHSHKDEFKLYRSEKNEFISHLYISPSLMPDEHNPGFRIYKFDKDTYEILDYDQYYISLEELNDGRQVDFKKIYSCNEYYNMKDQSTDSWVRLYKNMTMDNVTADKYCTMYSYTGIDQKCIDPKSYLCDIAFINKTADSVCDS
jgi:sphingomyelin phosphodiesterase